MIQAIILATLIHNAPESRVSKYRAKKIAVAITYAAARWRVSQTLLAAIALHESGGRNVVATGRGRGHSGCDVGVFQIHVPGCAVHRVRRFRDIIAAANRAAYLLSYGRALCLSGAKRWYCKIHYAGRYNPGSRIWLRRVLKLWWRLEANIK